MRGGGRRLEQIDIGRDGEGRRNDDRYSHRIRIESGRPHRRRARLGVVTDGIAWELFVTKSPFFHAICERHRY